MGALDQRIAHKPGTASQKQYRYCHQLQLKIAATGLWQQHAHCHLLPVRLQCDWSMYDHSCIWQQQPNLKHQVCCY